MTNATPTPERSLNPLRRLFLRLRRHTSSGLYIAELDGLRFMAILSVYIYHLSGDVLRHTSALTPRSTSFLFHLTQQLDIGVPLFFVISGMILGFPFARYWLQKGSRVSLKRYFVRRLTRLEPPYVLALLLCCLLKYAGGRGDWGDLLPHLGASLIYLHNLIYQEPSTINIVAWSLEVEVQFYLLAPFLACVFAINPAWVRRAVLLTATVAIAALAETQYLGALTHLTLAGNLQYFLTGFLLADIFLLIPVHLHRNWKWDLVTATGWPLLAVLIVSSRGLTNVALPAIILLLYVAAFYGTVSSRVFANLWISTIGGMCYTIYLLHNYTIAAIGLVTEQVGQSLAFEARLGLQMILISPFVLAGSIIYYILIEQPCMQPDWPSRLKRYIAGFRNVPFAPGTRTN